MEFTKLKIEKGFPAPVGKANFDFSLFEVEDCTFVATSDKINFNPAYISAIRYGRLNGKKFTGRTVVVDGVKGVRIWRIK